MTSEQDATSVIETAGHVLVVDDDRTSLTMASLILSKAGFQVSQAESGAACLEQVAAVHPDFVLLDIRMPGMDGYETCRRLREQEKTRDLQVVFVSGNDTLEDRIQAYEAGADDFISKPISVLELRRKAGNIMHIVEARRQQPTLAGKASAAAGDLAQMAMQSLQESNVVLAFTRGTLNCRTLEALASLTISSLRSYGLDSHVQLRSSVGVVTQTALGAASPLEEQIFEHVRDQGRLFQFQKRLVVNYDNCSILISNMPVEDADFCGRIRDYAAMIAEAADVAVENIALRLDAIQRAENLRELAQTCRSAIADLRERHQQQQTDIFRELDQTVENVEGMYYHLGLTDKQEDIISDLTRSSRDRVLALIQQGQSFDSELAGIVDDLARTLDTTPEHGGEEESAGDVDLWF